MLAVTKALAPPIRVYPVRISIRATAPLRLHAHQCAIIYSLLCNANGASSNLPPAMPDRLLLEAPERGRLELVSGETFQFGLCLLAESAMVAHDQLMKIVRGLESVGTTPPAATKGLRGNFAHVLATSLVGDSTAAKALDAIAPIPWDFVRDEIARAEAMSEVTLHFESPLRCERPNKERREGATCFGDSLFLPDVFLRRAARRLQELGFIEAIPAIAPKDVELIENRLMWLDVSYGPREHRKALGGAVGRIRLRLRDRGLAAILVLAQYARVGEKTRFGFGAFRIEELGPNPFACPRSTSLLELALRSTRLNAIAEEYQLESGRMSALAGDVLAGRYQPGAPRKILIRTEREDETPRLLCVPSREDRALQTAVLRQIAPALDLFFEESSLAYRRGLGRQRAAERLRQAYRDGFRWAVRSDIHRFFDSIDHARLRDRLEAYLADGPLVALIMRWVEGGAIQQGRGIPTGSPLSPLLSNLFLDQFDEQMEREGSRLVRYADDFLILVRDPRDASRMLDSAQAAARHLMLHLNDDKTEVIDLGKPFEFLGYRFEHRDSWAIASEHTMRHVDDLGWEQASRQPRTPGHLARLPGEVESASSPFSSLVIVGPGIDWAGVRGGDLVCRRRLGSDDLVFPLHRVDDLVILGGATLDASLMRSRRADPLGVWIADHSGRLRTVLLEETPLDNAELIREQVHAADDPGRALEIARRLVVSKLHHYALLAEATASDGPARASATTIRELADLAEGAETLEKLIGFEGAGASAWYRSLGGRIDRRFSFDHRVAPDAEDPINVLLNIGFSWLYRLAELLALQQGLAPSLGFLHQPRPGHSALASDLIEPFRHLVDRAVIAASQRLKPGDFRETRQGPYRLQIDLAASRSYLVLLHESLAAQCVGRSQTEPRGYRHQLAATIRALRRHLLDPTAPFTPFRHDR